MSLARSVAEVLHDHVTLAIEGIDRLYLNAYVPKLQYALGAVTFFRFHRGYPFASGALMDPISKRFIAAIERFTRDRDIPLITFAKGQRKDDVAAGYRARFDQAEGVMFVGKAQEKATVFRTEKRCHPETGQTYPWIVRATALVNQYYFYCVDRDFGPFFLKFCSYFPYPPSSASMATSTSSANWRKRASPSRPWIMGCCPARTRNGPKPSATGFRPGTSTRSCASG